MERALDAQSVPRQGLETRLLSEFQEVPLLPEGEAGIRGRPKLGEDVEEGPGGEEVGVGTSKGNPV